ncbi:MAG: polysaccharide deacetylase family protein [Kiritimatiellae bacterium]|nr:polysaccharide deacetylase family protein [Kiritimatiellia bacterium]
MQDEGPILATLALRDNALLPGVEERACRVPVLGLAGRPPPAACVAEFLAGPDRYAAVSREDGRLVFHFDIQRTITALLHEEFCAPSPPLVARLPVGYHLLPGRLRKGLGRALYAWHRLRRRRAPVPWPAWPIDRTLEVLLGLLRAAGRTCPDVITELPLAPGRRYVVCLTHDVDSRAGYERIERFLDLERKYGVTATYNIPGARYEVDRRRLSALVEAGFEIGLHGHDHSGRLAFLGEEEIGARIREGLQRFDGLDVCGFRSPMLLRSAPLFRALEGAVLYDSSVPDSGTFAGGAPFDGCASVFPFRRGKLLEIPVTMPSDADLQLCGWRADRIGALWMRKLDWIAAQGGVAVLVTHPEPQFGGDPRMLACYEQVLRRVAGDPGAQVMTGKALARAVLGREPA